jgi:hypothetical protein
LTPLWMRSSSASSDRDWLRAPGLHLGVVRFEPREHLGVGDSELLPLDNAVGSVHLRLVEALVQRDPPSPQRADACRVGGATAEPAGVAGRLRSTTSDIFTTARSYTAYWPSPPRDPSRRPRCVSGCWLHDAAAVDAGASGRAKAVEQPPRRRRSSHDRDWHGQFRVSRPCRNHGAGRTGRRSTRPYASSSSSPPPTRSRRTSARSWRRMKSGGG